MKRMICLTVGMFYLAGCSTMFNERKAIVNVDSDPKGAVVASNKLPRKATSPTSFSFNKDGQDVNVRLEMVEYTPQETILERRVTPSFWANFLWGWVFPIGMITDYLTGAMWNYQDTVYMKLEPIPSHSPAQ